MSHPNDHAHEGHRDGSARLLARVWRDAVRRCERLPWSSHGDTTAKPESPEHCAQDLHEQKTLLAKLVGDIESDFIGTGEALRKLAQFLGETQQACQELDALTSETGADAAVPFALAVLSRTETLVRACFERYDRIFADFGELQCQLAALPTLHEGLVRVLLPLNFITTTFRMEAARHQPEVQALFFTLADEVSHTVQEVRGTLRHQFDDLTESERQASALMQQAILAIRRHRDEMAATLATSRTHLDALHQAVRASSSSAADLVELNQRTQRHIGSMVVAQQCEDITRQRVAHINDAITEMLEHLESHRPTRSTIDPDTRHFITHAAQIQFRQIQTVFQDLNQASSTLSTGVTHLQTDAAAASDLSIKVAQSTMDANVTRLCQGSIGDLLRITHQTIERVADIHAALAPLQAKLTNCSDQAKQLAVNLRHDSLNAQVFAIHVENGATLEVLASRMHSISHETVRAVEDFVSALRRTGQQALQLGDSLIAFRDATAREQETLAGEFSLARTKLGTLETDIPALIGRISELQRSCASEARDLVSSIRFPDAVAHAEARCTPVFQRLSAWEQRASLPPASGRVQARLQALFSNYTMESERHAHHGVVAAAAPVASGSKAAAPVAVATDNNVELF